MYNRFKLLENIGGKMKANTYSRQSMKIEILDDLEFCKKFNSLT